MSTFEFEKLLEQVPSLRSDERRQLREVLSRPSGIGQLSEDEFEQLLIETGFLGPMGDRSEPRAWAPLIITGEPLSQTIVKERR